MGRDLINERIRDTETGEIGLVVKTQVTERGEEVGYLTTDAQGNPKINWQTVGNVVVIMASIWETIFPLIKEAITYFFGDPKTWKARIEARRALKQSKK